MNLESVDDISEDTDEGNNPPLVVGQQSRRLPLWVNEDWTPENDQPLLEDHNRDVAYWFDVSDVQNLVDFVKAKEL